MTVGIIPLNIDFLDWASQIRISFPTIDIPTPPDSVLDWIGWASQIVYNNNLSNVPTPNETAYPLPEDWRNWAAYFINSVSTIST